jgi:hypothetical protein
MSIIDRARSSAGATLEQGRSTMGSTVGTVSSRVRALPADTWNISRSAITLARRQALVTVGAGDAIVATVTRQREELPVQAKLTADKLAGATKDRVTAASAAAARIQQTIASAASTLTVGRVKGVAENGSAQAKDAYAKLAVRGEQVTADLRHDPMLVRVIRRADGRVENAANGVTSVAQKVRARAMAQAKREGAATSATPVRITPANKVPAHRTTVRNTPAAEAAVSTTPTHRAAAYETATRQAAAKKAAATRKAAAEKAAATRKAAAKKAAATRKAAAVEAAAKHEAAVKKAAATRKKNAAARDRAATTRRTAAAKAAATRKKNAANA